MERSYLAPPEKVLAELQVSEERGLSSTRVEQLRAKYGPNGECCPSEICLSYNANADGQRCRKTPRRHYGGWCWNSSKTNWW